MDNLRIICRTCGTTTNEELCTKLFEEMNYPLVTLIEDITDMWIEQDNDLPECICIGCKSMLEQIVEFRSSCLSTHKKLLAARKEDIKNNKDQDAMDYNNIEIIDVSNPGPDDGEYNLQLDTTLSRCDSLIATDNDAAESQSPVKAKKVNNTMKPAKKRQKISKTWICELCGGQFKCSTYLKLHLLRHTGKKEFECDICKGKYYTQNEMQRHKILHTSAKPYACRFCDKTFRGTSSKAVHERSHTNERPFSCQFCEKSFRSTSVRKMHERVHVNNRSFHCEPCDQWFLRSTHLSLHQRTKLHKSKIAND